MFFFVKEIYLSQPLHIYHLVIIFSSHNPKYSLIFCVGYFQRGLAPISGCSSPYLASKSSIPLSLVPLYPETQSNLTSRTRVRLFVVGSPRSNLTQVMFGKAPRDSLSYSTLSEIYWVSRKICRGRLTDTLNHTMGSSDIQDFFWSSLLNSNFYWSHVLVKRYSATT